MSSSCTRLLFTCVLLVAGILASSHCLQVINKPTNGSRRRHYQLSVDHYDKTCPEVENLVASITSQQFKIAPVSAPATIRLFFHDCFVGGCDGSILISSSSTAEAAESSKLVVLAEKDAEDNKNLAAEAFECIEKAKALVESKCPGVVSCADILAISARDFVHLVGGPYYGVSKGRWDGKVSMASRVSSNLPRPNSTMEDLINLFTSKGLTVEDLVVLSGAHTIGFSHCEYIINRVYYNKKNNITAKGKQPPSTVGLNIDPRLLKALTMTCPQYGGNADIVVPFDVTTPFTFDNQYYGNLEKSMGLLITDQLLFLDPRTKPLVQALSKDKPRFFQAFSQAMEKMGSIGVKRGTKHGEKRKHCSSHG
ncbi:hypothetical protein Dimus_035237 [Dionaea muscipula]